MLNLDDNHQIWTTTDLGLAAAIITAGHSELVDLDRSNPRRVVFVFNYTVEIDDLCRDYWSNATSLDARTLFENIRRLKGRVYNG